MPKTSTSFGIGNTVASKYKPEYCEMAVEFGRQGKTRMELAAEIGVSKETIRNWEGKHKHFASALNMMEDYAVAWYQGIGRRALLGELKFDAVLYKFLTKSRFLKREEFKDQDQEVQDKQVNIIVNSSPIKGENA